MRQQMHRSHALGGVALALALAGGGVGLSFATPARALEPSAALTDTEPPPEPSPDPAPAPAPPKPKPASKPARPAPTYHAPSHVFKPPTHASPTHTPSHATTHTKPKTARHRLKHPQHRSSQHRSTHTVAKPKPETQPKQPTVGRIHIGAQTTLVTPARDSPRRGFVIAGIGLAALLFLLVVAVPSSAARFTTAGRAVVDHQSGLVLAGVVTLFLTALFFALTRTGS